MLIGYARVSTADQKLDLQKDELKRTWGRETRLQMHEKAAQKTPGAYPDITPQLTGKHAPASR